MTLFVHNLCETFWHEAFICSSWNYNNVLCTHGNQNWALNTKFHDNNACHWVHYQLIEICISSRLHFPVIEDLIVSFIPIAPKLSLDFIGSRHQSTPQPRCSSFSKLGCRWNHASPWLGLILALVSTLTFFLSPWATNFGTLIC